MSAKQFLKKIFPESLWSPRYRYWWCVCLVNILVFDVLWMAQTTFRPFSHTAFWAYLLLGTLLLSLPTLIVRRSWLQVVVLLGVDLLFVANLMYYNTYFNPIPPQSYGLAANLKDFTDSVQHSWRWQYLLLFVVTVAAPFFARRFTGVGKDVGPRRRRAWLLPYAVTLLALCVVAWAIDAGRGGPFGAIKGMRFNAHKRTCIVPIYTIGGYLAYELAQRQHSLSPQQKNEVGAWLDEHRQQQSFASKSDSTSVRKNIVYILCESLESWVVGLKVDGREITPNLTKWVNDSTTFYAPNVVSQADTGRSIDGQLLGMTGLLPMRSEVFSFFSSENTYYSLPKAMGAGGGRSYLLTVDKPLTWNQFVVADQFGVDTVLYNSSWNVTETVGAGRLLSDGQFMRQTVDKLASGQLWPAGENALVTMVTYSGHFPFKLPEKLKKIDLSDKYPELVSNYMTMVNYTDSALGVLVDYLKTRPDWNETIVVITGDHEGLVTFRKDFAGLGFVDMNEHVPFIVLNATVPGRFNGQMGQVDIYPTVLDMMGWGDYPWRGMGFSALDPNHPRVAVDARDIVRGDTAGVEAHKLKALKDARDISDRIIRFNLLKDTVIQAKLGN